MKWFQHHAKSNTDPRLQKVLIKFGFEGYGLYWYCIESICQNLEPKLTFELEQDSEILAHIGRMDSRRVEEIMTYMVSLELFSESAGVIVCRKLARYLGDNLTRNADLKTIIQQEKKGYLSQTVSDSLRLSHGEERRGEEKKTTKGRFAPPSVEEVGAYCLERGNGIDPSAFIDHYAANGWMRGKNKIKDWKACVRTWEQRQPKAERVEEIL